jgi:hypothetical protein
MLRTRNISRRSGAVVSVALLVKETEILYYIYIYIYIYIYKNNCPFVRL